MSISEEFIFDKLALSNVNISVESLKIVNSVDWILPVEESIIWTKRLVYSSSKIISLLLSPRTDELANSELMSSIFNTLFVLHSI